MQVISAARQKKRLAAHTSDHLAAYSPSAASMIEPRASTAPQQQTCARKTRRYCLVLINVLVLVIGLFFLGVGVAAQTQCVLLFLQCVFVTF
jgi:hypothetical protein